MSLIGNILSGAIAFTAGLSQNRTNESASDVSFQSTRTDGAQKLYPGYMERSASINVESRPKREFRQSIPGSCGSQANCVMCVQRHPERFIA